MRTEQKKNHKNITSFLFFCGNIAISEFWSLAAYKLPIHKNCKYLELKKSISFIQVPTHYLKPLCQGIDISWVKSWVIFGGLYSIV